MSLDNTTHEKLMHRCLELAAKGLGRTRSNPMVGAVILHKGLIIGEGYHQEFGGPHAEVNAVNTVKNKELLKDSTLYVNLEPCNHHGKTPPCTHLITNLEIPRVVVGATDPNPLVSGKGIEYLRDAGVMLTSGVLEDECRFLNRRFYTFHENKRPYIILKWAQTKDGFIDNRESGDVQNTPLRITGDTARIMVHKWRSEEMAIMAGTQTMNMDDPSLTVRYWTGENPLRITMQRDTPLRKDLKIFHDKIDTIIYSKNKNSCIGNAEYISPTNKFDFPETILEDLFRRNVLSVIIEGGTKLLKLFLDKRLWDEARVFTGNINAVKGTPAPVFHLHKPVFKAGKDDLSIAYRKNY